MYTVTINSTVHRHQSAIDAADLLLSHDGYEHEIRRDEEGGHTLWLSQFSRNSPYGGKGLNRSVIYSIEDDLALASLEIALKALRCGFWESDSVIVLSDEEYDAMLAENAAENEGV